MTRASSKAIDDANETFDEELQVDIGNRWVMEMLGTRSKNRRVRASAIGLAVEGMRPMAHDEIETAFASARKQQRVVVADRAGRRVTIHVASRAEATRLLKALSFTTTEKNAVFQLLPSFHLPATSGLILPFAVLSAVLLAKEKADALPLIALLALAILIVAALKIFGRKLTVGSDGVSISGIWGKRFISYSDFVTTRRYSDITDRYRNRGRRNEVIYSGVLLNLRGGEEVRLPIIRGQETDDELLGASQRIGEALNAWHLAQPVVHAAIDRDGRDTHEWISSLRQLGKSEATTYRVAAVDREALFAIVEDPANQAVSRVAAAVAISGRLDDEARARLRKSAEAVADPKLRVAMDHVVNENDDDIRAALDEFESETTK